MLVDGDNTPWELTQRTTTSHGEIAFDVFGSAGTPIVLAHGTPSRSFVWRNVAPVLAESFTVYVYDLLGYGDSEREEEQEVSVAVQGSVLAELSRKWELDRPALVGHDIGGATVLRAHLLERVAARQLALIDAVVLRPWVTPVSRHIQAHLDAYRTMPAHIFREVAAGHLRTATYRPMLEETFDAVFSQWEGERGQALWLRNVAQFDERHTAELEPFLEAMQTPTHIFWGEQDAWLDLEMSERLERRLPNAVRTVLPKAGHFAMEDRPDELAEGLSRFLRGELARAP